MTVAFAAFAIGQVTAQSGTAPAAGDDVTNQTAVVKHDCGKFTDANSDGICDNAAAHAGNAKGANYVDANGDGVCDHNAGGAACKGNGNYCKGNGQQMHNCPKGQPNCCGQAKGNGEQHKHGCESKCPAHSAPDKK